jgi:hypothetical protein
MGSGWYVAILLCGAQSRALAQVVSDRFSLDFLLGETIGSCLVRSCAIFRGTILTDLPKPAGKIVLRVDEALYGLPAGISKLEVPYTTHVSNYTALLGSNQPWELTATKNTSLTVVLTKKRLESFEAGAIMLGTTDQRPAAIMRALAAEANRLDADPASISASVTSLSQNWNPAMEAYLEEYLFFHQGEQGERNTLLMLDLIDNSVISSQACNRIAEFAAVAYYYPEVSAAFKAQLVMRFSQRAQQPNSEKAEAGYRGLARIARDLPSGTVPLPSETVASLAQNYRALVQKGVMKRNQPVEKALGISLQ